jgi:hypothetical protein
MEKQFFSIRKLNSFGALVQVVLENFLGGTSTFSKRITINQNNVSSY